MRLGQLLGPIAGLLALAAQAPARDQFRLRLQAGRFELTATAEPRRQPTPIPQAWLIPPDEERKEEEEEEYVSFFNFDTVVNAFPLGNGWIGLHMSSYETGEGSAMAGAGRDVFLILHPGSGRITRGLVNLGVTKDRLRWMGCLIAHASHFLLADINRDSIVDIGRIAEQLDCEYVRDASGAIQEPRGVPYYTQSAIRWYVFSGDRWDLQAQHDGKMPDRFIELPLIGTTMTPVDFFAEYRWHSFDPDKWNSPGKQYRFVPAYRRQLIERETGTKP